MSRPWSGIRDAVLEEMKSRIVPDTASPPVRHGPFLYSSRYRRGEEYPVFCRRRAGSEGRRAGREELLLDGNQLAREAHGEAAEGYFSMGALEISPNHEVLAFAADTVGRRLYELRFLDTRSGGVLPDRIPGAAPNVVWAAAGDAVFYTRPDPETLRWSKVMLHRLGQPVEHDALVYEETDETFWVAAHESRSREFVLLHCEQTDGRRPGRSRAASRMRHPAG